MVKQRILGRTGLAVSEISLGTVEIGMDYGIGHVTRPDESDAAALLHRAVDAGVNFIDTARAYGASEAIIGRALADRRQEYVLVSKAQVGSRAAVLASVQESLSLLQTDFIDILMIHSAPLAALHDGEMQDVFSTLRGEGRIRFTGASVYGAEAAVAAIESGFFDCIQVAYNVLDRRMENIASLAQEHGVGLVARSVLLKGALTNRSGHLPEALTPLRESVSAMQAIAQACGVPLPELAYRYVLSTGCVQSALVGASTISELEQALAFAQVGELPASVMKQIQDSTALDEFYLNPGNWPS